MLSWLDRQRAGPPPPPHPASRQLPPPSWQTQLSIQAEQNPLGSLTPHVLPGAKVRSRRAQPGHWLLKGAEVLALVGASWAPWGVPPAGFLPRPWSPPATCPGSALPSVDPGSPNYRRQGPRSRFGVPPVLFWEENAQPKYHLGTQAAVNRLPIRKPAVSLQLSTDGAAVPTSAFPWDELTRPNSQENRRLGPAD